MSSQDTTSYAQSEEEKAKIIQSEIGKEQADITALQNDINNKSQVISGLQEKQQQHARDGERLRQQAIDEQKQEQQEQLRQQQKDSDKGMGEAARDGIINNIF